MLIDVGRECYDYLAAIMGDIRRTTLSRAIRESSSGELLLWRSTGVRRRESQEEYTHAIRLNRFDRPCDEDWSYRPAKGSQEAAHQPTDKQRQRHLEYELCHLVGFAVRTNERTQIDAVRIG